MKHLLGKKMVKKKEQSCSSSSSSRYSRLDNINDRNDEIRKGYVPVIVGMCEEEEERFMLPLGLINHPTILGLLDLSANEFGYHQQGVIQIPCQPHQFRLLLDTFSCK
ncbi:unnamed protein product [Amaranthus hypochondriacus]